jgi:hypothetical protein
MLVKQGIQAFIRNNATREFVKRIFPRIGEEHHRANLECCEPEVRDEFAV